MSSRSLQTEDTPGVCAAILGLEGLEKELLLGFRRDGIDRGDLGVRPPPCAGDAPVEADLQDDKAEFGPTQRRLSCGADGTFATRRSVLSASAGRGMRNVGTDSVCGDTSAELPVVIASWTRDSARSSAGSVTSAVRIRSRASKS
mmetsp:Transcript_111397/g.296018  ORF Transcript_111397/g.296018 Transcript_111397/m.296018 type:complete len:145 (-) Transcript_111397:61-495(-)